MSYPSENPENSDGMRSSRSPPNQAMSLPHWLTQRGGWLSSFRVVFTALTSPRGSQSFPHTWRWGTFLPTFCYAVPTSLQTLHAPCFPLLAANASSLASCCTPLCALSQLPGQCRVRSKKIWTAIGVRNRDSTTPMFPQCFQVGNCMGNSRGYRGLPIPQHCKGNPLCRWN